MDKNDKAEDVYITINGEKTRLRMTLGAMAAFERSLGVSGMKEMEERLANPSLTDVQNLALALIRGGGERVPDDFFMTASVDFRELMAGVMKSVQLAFGRMQAEGEDNPSGNVTKG